MNNGSADLERRLVVAVGVVMLLVVGGVLSFVNTRKLMSDAHWLQRAQAVKVEIGDILNTTVEAESSYRGFVITNNAALLAAYEAAENQLPGKLAELAALVADNPQQQHQAALLVRTTDQCMTEWRTGIQLRKEQGFSAAESHIASGEGQRLHGLVRALCAQMVDAQNRLLAQRQLQTDRAYEWAIASSLIVAVLGLLAVGAYLRQLHHWLLSEQLAGGSVYQQSEVFRTTLNNIGDAVIGTDKSGRVTFLNAVAQKLTGWREEDATGQPLENVFQIISESTRDPVINPAAQALAEGRILGLNNHTLLVARDGTERPIADSSAPIRNAQGQTTGAVLVFHDLTAARRLQEQFRQSQRMEAVGRLAGGIAHDFNNLLTVINGYCQLVEGDPTVSENSRDFLGEIHRAGDRAAALIHQLLAFSRSQMLQPTLIDLNEVVSSAGSLLKRLIGEDAIMHLNLAPDLGNIKADRGQIEQILINFAVNARDAMPSGGEIFIDTANVNVSDVNSGSHADAVEGEYVMLAFKDTGMGMDESVRMRVFEPYFTTKEYGKGTGLGLATVLGIVKQNDGYISVHSQPSAGTTFKIYFPRAWPIE